MIAYTFFQCVAQHAVVFNLSSAPPFETNLMVTILFQTNLIATIATIMKDYEGNSTDVMTMLVGYFLYDLLFMALNGIMRKQIVYVAHHVLSCAVIKSVLHQTSIHSIILPTILLLELANPVSAAYELFRRTSLCDMSRRLNWVLSLVVMWNYFIWRVVGLSTYVGYVALTNLREVPLTAQMFVAILIPMNCYWTARLYKRSQWLRSAIDVE